MNKIRRTKSDIVFDTVNYILLSLILLCVMYPMYFMVIASFSDPTAVNNGQAFLLPKGMNLGGYKKILGYSMIWTGYKNSIIYTFVATSISIIVTMMLAYTLSKKRFAGKRLLLLYVMIPMYFSGGMIPTFLLVQSLGLYNNPAVMIIIGMVSTFNVIVARTSIQNTIPEELYEAAWMDGCSHIRFFFEIVMPLSKAIIAVLILYYGIANWNGYMNALIYLNSREYQPLQIVLREILIQSQIAADLTAGAEDAVKKQYETELMKYALIIVATLPVMTAYPFLQKYFTKGIMIGSVKG